MTIRLLAALLLASLQLIARPADARQGDWRLLGQQSVGFAVDRDVVQVGSDKGAFTQLQLRVFDNDVYVYRLKAVYANGETETLEINDRLRSGEKSGLIDLKGRQRRIEKVELFYRSAPSIRGRARVELWGQEGSRPAPTARDYFAWRNLESAAVSQRAERVVLAVPQREREQDFLRLRVQENALAIRRVVIVFADDTVQEVSLTDALKVGEATRPIDVEGRNRAIKEVVVYLRRLRGDRAARLSLQGGRKLPPPQAVPSGYVLFGTQRVDPTVDRDVIKVGRDKGVFEQLIIQALREDVEIRDVKVVYANGETDDLKTQDQIGANRLSRPIRLQRDGRIDEIRLVYKTPPGAGFAIVNVYGDYSDRWLKRRAERLDRRGVRRDGRGRGRDQDDEWLLIGSQPAQMLGFDRDEFTVGRKFGKFKRLRLAAKGNAIRVYDLKVKFANGEVADLPAERELRDNGRGDVIDLPGDARFIESVAITYRTRLNLGGDAIVELWGLQD